VRRVLGAVLAGGRSRRFGSDKALAVLRGRPLIDWTAELLAGWTERIVVCGRSGGLADRPGPDFGPLGGLNAALHFARAEGFDAVLSAPCDTPLLPEDALRRLCESETPAYLEALPVVGLWPCAFADALDLQLAGDDRSMRGWASRIGASPIRLDQPIANVNTQDDLLRLARGDAR
jgi:molybdopterin-guanine dinucleotide biosynthesis protein A